MSSPWRCSCPGRPTVHDGGLRCKRKLLMAWVHDLSGEQSAMVSAALRHIEDAHWLLDISPVQAAYVAGYGPECARKAALASWTDRENLRNRMIGHRFDQTAEIALSLFCDLDPLAPRYNLQRWTSRRSTLGEWKEDLRYARSDALPRARARRIVEAATALTTETLAKLWADGRLEPVASLTEVKP